MVPCPRGNTRGRWYPRPLSFAPRGGPFVDFSSGRTTRLFGPCCFDLLEDRDALTDVFVDEFAHLLFHGGTVSASQSFQRLCDPVRNISDRESNHRFTC